MRVMNRIDHIPYLLEMLWGKFLTDTKAFWTRVYPRGSYVITHVRPWSVRGPSIGLSLNISETALGFF